MTGRTLATLEEIMADFEWATTDKKDGDTDAVYRRYFPDLLAIAQGQRARLQKAREDINWMLNSRQFLNPEVFDYLDEK